MAIPGSRIDLSTFSESLAKCMESSVSPHQMSPKRLRITHADQSENSTSMPKGAVLVSEHFQRPGAALVDRLDEVGWPILVGLIGHRRRQLLLPRDALCSIDAKVQYGLPADPAEPIVVPAKIPAPVCLRRTSRARIPVRLPIASRIK